MKKRYVLKKEIKEFLLDSLVEATLLISVVGLILVASAIIGG